MIGPVSVIEVQYLHSMAVVLNIWVHPPVDHDLIFGGL